jgi:hypothetical protein
MRIPTREVLFIGQNRCPEFDCHQEPPPEELNVLLCLLDGAERRRQLQAKLNALRPDLRPEMGEPSVSPAAKR